MFICFGLSVLIIGLIHYVLIPLTDESFLIFYKGELRDSFFTAFLSVGGLLLTLKTFIILHMKEQVYDNSEYDELFQDLQKQNSDLKNKYLPLQKLSTLLFVSVCMSLGTAIYHITIGLMNHWLVAVISMFLSISTLLFFIISLIQIRTNITVWFDHLDSGQ